MFTKRRTFLLAVVGVGLVLALCLACAAGEEEEATPAAGETPGAEPTATKVVLPTPTPTPLGGVEVLQGGVLRIVGLEPPNWDGHRQHSYKTQEAVNFIHTKLVQFRYGPEYSMWDFTITPGVAESWEVSPDGLVYTFHLRQGVKWQDIPPVNGRELTAEDIKWSYDHFRTLSPPATYAWKLDDVDNIECPDKYTLVINLKEPRSGLLGFLADPYITILPREVEEMYGDYYKSETAIGAGPFMLKEYTPDVGSIFVKNPTYYRADEGLPYVDEVRWMVIPDSSTTLAGFRAGTLDIRGISRLDLESVKATNPGIHCYETELGTSTSHLTIRVDQPPFDDVLVRRAMSMALNRQEIIDSIYLGYGVAQIGPMHVGSDWYLEDVGECAKYWQYNPEEAKKLLAEAGYPDGFDTTLNVSLGYGATYEEYAELWQDYLNKIGVRATIQPHEYVAGVSTMATGKNTDLWWKYNYGTALDPDEWVLQLYMPGSIKNWAKVDDPKITEFMEAQLRAMNVEERKQILDEFQRYEACQVNYIPWPRPYSITCMQPWLHGYKSHTNYYDTGRIYEIVWVDEESPTRQ